MYKILLYFIIATSSLQPAQNSSSTVEQGSVELPRVYSPPPYDACIYDNTAMTHGDDYNMISPPKYDDVLKEIQQSNEQTVSQVSNSNENYVTDTSTIQQTQVDESHVEENLHQDETGSSEVCNTQQVSQGRTATTEL